MADDGYSWRQEQARLSVPNDLVDSSMEKPRCPI